MRLSGGVFGIFYLLQITVLPVFHYQMHTSEGCNNGRDHHSYPSHRSSSEKKKAFEQANNFECHHSTVDGHSSDDSDFCSLCLGVHKGATFSINASTLVIEFPVVVDAIDYGKLHLSNYSSSNPPRAPPVSLS